MPSKTWGTPQLIEEYIVVGEDKEIPSGHKAYILNRDSREHSVLGIPTWETFLQGDLTQLKERIEQDIPNTKVLWIQISWSNAVLQQKYPEYWVYGFTIEAIVENLGGAALTGFEIALIIIAFAFLAVVIASIALGAWIVWEIMGSVPDVVKPFVGVGLLVLLLLFLLLMFGGQIGVSKKKVTVKGR